MATPSTYQSRKVATFSTNGILWTKSSDDVTLYRDLGFETQDRGRTFSVKRSSAGDNSSQGLVARLRSYDNSDAAAKAYVDLSVRMNFRTNTVITEALVYEDLLTGVFDFISNVSLV